jgi:hypothetical protein
LSQIKTENYDRYSNDTFDFRKVISNKLSIGEYTTRIFIKKLKEIKEKYRLEISNNKTLREIFINTDSADQNEAEFNISLTTEYHIKRWHWSYYRLWYGCPQN